MYTSEKNSIYAWHAAAEWIVDVDGMFHLVYYGKVHPLLWHYVNDQN